MMRPGLLPHLSVRDAHGPPEAPAATPRGSPQKAPSYITNPLRRTLRPRHDLHFLSYDIV